MYKQTSFLENILCLSRDGYLHLAIYILNSYIMLIDCNQLVMQLASIVHMPYFYCLSVDAAVLTGNATVIFSICLKFEV